MCNGEHVWVMDVRVSTGDHQIWNEVAAQQPGCVAHLRAQAWRLHASGRV